MSAELPSPSNPPRVVLELRVPMFVWVAVAGSALLFAWGTFIVADEWVAGQAKARHVTAPATAQTAALRP